MKVLFLVQQEQRAILDRLYDGIAAHCDLDIRFLSSDEQANLRRYFREHVDMAAYARILLFLRFKKEIRQVAFIRRIEHLAILEHDAYQNYIPCKYTGKFSAHYRRLPWARVITSGAVVARRLREEGVDACFVPKGYDATLLGNDHGPRDIELGFLGSVKSAAYAGRKQLLEALQAVEPLQATRTASGSEYRQALNRIRYFVSADVGMGEYMIKNFEAMACGCVLLAFDQGEEENRALGFVDLHNVVLYSDLASLRAQLTRLRQTPGLAEQIAARGQALVEQQYSFLEVGRQVVDALRSPLRSRPALSIWQRLAIRLRP